MNLSENYVGETKWDPSQRQQTSTAVHAFAAALESNTTLTRLDLSNNSVGDDGVLALARSMKANKTMKALELAGNNVVTPKGREVLTQRIRIRSENGNCPQKQARGQDAQAPRQVT